jgi:hypothetical protein
MAAAQAKKAAPPKPEEFVGTSIGSGEDETFTRLALWVDFTGYCAFVAPPEFITHEYRVSLYRVLRRSLEGWKLNVTLTPISSHDERIYLKGLRGTLSLQLKIGGVNKKWNQRVLLRKESRIEISNSENEEDRRS